MKKDELILTLKDAIGDLDTDGYHEYAKAIRQAVAQFSADRAFYSAYVNDQQEILRGLEARLAEATQAGILEKSRSEGLETEITAIRTHLLARAEAAEAEVKRLNTLLAIIFNDKQKALEMVEANQTAFNSARMDFIKLESEVKALREALEKIVKQSGWMLAEGPLIQSMAKTARAALDRSGREES
jgi:hypothetical protein